MRFSKCRVGCRCDGDATHRLGEQEFSSPRYSHNMNRVCERVRHAGNLTALDAPSSNGSALTILLYPINPACRGHVTRRRLSLKKMLLFKFNRRKRSAVPAPEHGSFRWRRRRSLLHLRAAPRSRAYRDPSLRALCRLPTALRRDTAARARGRTCLLPSIPSSPPSRFPPCELEARKNLPVLQIS